VEDFCAMASGSLGGTRKPLYPSIIWSGIPPTLAREPKAFQRLGPSAV